MPSAKTSRKQKLQEIAASWPPGAVGEARWEEVRQALAPVSADYLSRLLRESGFEVEQPWAGVRMGAFDSLEQSLIRMLAAYDEALRLGRRDLAGLCRRQVIRAKERARAQAANLKLSSQAREAWLEKAQWALVWLENPPLFPAWCRLRLTAAPELLEFDRVDVDRGAVE